MRALSNGGRITAGVAALALLLGPTWTAAADEQDLHEGFYVVRDGEYIPVPTDVFIDDAEEPSGGEGATPYLIGFPQWVACYTFNNESEVFVSYPWAWDGESSTKNLMCGNSSWGYKHIESGHGTDWQNKLDQIRAMGYGFDITWDDVMAAGIWAGLSWPDYTRFKPASNSACVVGELAYFTDDFEVIQSFNVTTAFATDSTRIITSYPNSGSTC